LGKNPDFQFFLHSGEAGLGLRFSPSTRPSNPGRAENQVPYTIPLMALNLFPLGRANKGRKTRNKKPIKCFSKSLQSRASLLVESAKNK